MLNVHTITVFHNTQLEKFEINLDVKNFNDLYRTTVSCRIMMILHFESDLKRLFLQRKNDKVIIKLFPNMNDDKKKSFEFRSGTVISHFTFVCYLILYVTKDTKPTLVKKKKQIRIAEQ